MQVDKNLKALLMKWGIENPSADFTGQVMQRITSAYTYNTPAQPLLKQKLPRLLLAMFILICMILVALSFRLPAIALPFQFSVGLPATYFSQGFYFLIAFWVVMLLNVGFKKFFPLLKL